MACWIGCVLQGAALSQPSDSLESLLASAHEAQARSDFQSAAEFYRQAVQLHPEVAELNANLGLMYYQLGKDQQAIDALVRANRLKPALLVPDLFLGLEYVKLKKFKEAISHLRRATAAKPSDVQVQVALGQAYAGTGETRLATRSYRRATELEPQSADHWYRLGVSYLEQVEVDTRILLTRDKDSPYLLALIADNLSDRHAFIQAADAYQKALALRAAIPGEHASYGFVLLNRHDIEGAQDQFQSELASYPGSLWALLGRARLQVERGAADAGAKDVVSVWNSDRGFLENNVQRLKSGITPAERAELQRALERQVSAGGAPTDLLALFQPSDGSEPVSQVRNSLQAGPSTEHKGGSAEVAFAKGLYGQCASVLASQFSALSAKQLRTLAVCAYSTGAYRQAAEAADKMALTASTEAEGLYWETKSCQRLAAEALTYASSIDSGSPEMHILLGDIYRQKNQTRDAEREYRKALALRPGDTGALFGLSLALLADEQIVEALGVAQAGLKGNPDDPELNAVMGEILCERQDFTNAEVYLKKSLNTKPEYVSHVHALLGKVYARTNRPQEAVAEFKLALPDDQDGRIYYQIGRVYVSLGERDAAQEAFAISKRLKTEGLTRAAVSLQPPDDDSE